MKKIVFILIIILLMTTLISCTDNNKSRSIIVATTTSTRDSGLLDYLIPYFTNETNIDVKLIVSGTGKALQMGRDGEVDALLVHSKEDEEKFVKDHHGMERKDVMYNDFVLVGPDNDMSKNMGDNDILKGYKFIYDNQLNFVSRGDNSGTNKKELILWSMLDYKPKGNWYISSGNGMGATLKIANEKEAYTMTDRATYLNLKDSLDLKIIIEKDELLYNQYGVITVNPNKNKNINYEDAKVFMKWITSNEAKSLIKEYGKDKFGMSLFIPN